MAATNNGHVPQFVSIGDISSILGVSRQTVRKWDSQNRISCYRTGPNGSGMRRFNLQEILSELEWESKITQPKRRVHLYCRVSTRKQAIENADGESNLSRQVARLTSHVCEHHQCSPDDLVIHREISSAWASRPVMCRLLDSVLADEVSEIWVEHKDRWQRSPNMNKLTEWLFEKGNTKFISLDLPNDEQTEADNLAELLSYCTILSCRTHGKRGGLATTKTLSDESITVARQMILEGHTVATICRELKRLGHKTTTPKGCGGFPSRRIVEKFMRSIDLTISDDDRQEHNSFLIFAKERLKSKQGSRISGSEIYESYQGWCQQKCKVSLDKQQVGRLMNEKFSDQKFLVSGWAHYKDLKLKG